MGFLLDGPSRGWIITLLILVASLGKGESATCAPYPISARVGNITLSNGQISRGVAYSVGTPAQDFSFLPQWPLNNVLIYGTNGYCTSSTLSKEDSCTTWRGGQYNSLASDTRRVAPESSYPKDAGRVPNMNFVLDQLKLNDNITLAGMPMGIPLEDWGQEGYRPMMAFGLGANSSILNALKASGNIVSRTWSMFHGWTGASTKSQVDGTFVFGGYDRAKVSGRGYTTPMSDRGSCESRLLVTIGDIVLNFPNGTTASLFRTDSESVSACISPDFPVLMTIPQNPYFAKFQALTETSLLNRTFGGAYYSMLYSEGDEPYNGDLTIKIQSGPSIRIPNHQLVVPDRYVDSETGEWKANASSPNLIMNPIQDVNADDLIKLGRQFLSSAYIMANHDTEEFTIWTSNPTEAVDLVAIDETGEEVTDFCDTQASALPSPSYPPTPSADPTDVPEASEELPIGIIVGASVGGAVLIIIGVVAFLFIRRRRRRRNLAAGNGSQQPRDMMDDTGTDPRQNYSYAEATESSVVSELPIHSYPKDGYHKPELPGTVQYPYIYDKTQGTQRYELHG